MKGRCFGLGNRMDLIIRVVVHDIGIERAIAPIDTYRVPKKKRGVIVINTAIIEFDIKAVLIADVRVRDNYRV